MPYIQDVVKNDAGEDVTISIDTEVGAMIAKASTEAQLQVTLKWEQKDSSDGKY